MDSNGQMVGYLECAFVVSRDAKARGTVGIQWEVFLLTNDAEPHTVKRVKS